MAIYEIVQVGDDVLREKCQPVNEVNDTVRELLDDMAETMYHADGVGLAAPQVGIPKRIIVVDVGEGLVQLVNPELVNGRGRQTDEEGCLSVVGVTGTVERYKTVMVKGLDRNGKGVLIKASGLYARALQHEMDHLDGILFIDKVVKK
ncbi:MAG: peptide deformylase [Bacillota bacterium]|nr:peptide deformylase [Bacillota bacterium]